jgi:hypothetical protein
MTRVVAILCLIAVVGSGCGPRKPFCEKQRIKTELCQRIDAQVNVGMSMHDAEKLMEPTVPFRDDLPFLAYTDEEGWTFYMAFFEFDPSKYSSKQTGLTAVVVYPKGEGMPKFMKPESLSGRDAKQFWMGRGKHRK